MPQRLKTPFSDLVPSLSSDEIAVLKADIAANGVQIPIAIDEDGNILDGHHRYKCDKNAPTRIVKGLTIAEKEAYAITANVTRRNLSPSQRAELREKQKSICLRLKEEDKKKWTQKRLAVAVGVSQFTISQWISDATNIDTNNGCTPTPASLDARVIIPPEAKPVILKRIESGETQEKVADDFKVSHQAISKVIQSQKRKAEVEKKKDEIAKKKAGPHKKLYGTVVVDPPWDVRKIERDCRPNQVRSLDYPTMPISEIIDARPPMAANCHLWVWTTHKYLPDAFDILSAWGAKYVCTFVWHKPGGFQPTGLPQYNCEFALYARCGSPKFTDTKSLKLCFQAKRGKHSEKPEEFYAMVRRVTNSGRLDMYNRREIDGFDGWGNEA